MIWTRRLATGLMLLTGLAGLRAENYTYVSGVIVDSSTASVPGATVSVINEDSGMRRNTISQIDGSYMVSSLEPGVYKVIVRTSGFRTMIRFGVRVSEFHPARVDFKLVVGSVQETITVEGSALMIESDNTSVSTVLRGEDVQRLPVNGGGLLDALQLAPGLIVTPATRGEAGQFTVNGQRPNTHYFTVDGASVNSGVSGGGLPAQSTGGALPGMTAFGSLDGLVSKEALEEMRVQTSSSAAAFGRLPGAQISLNSRSGSNQWHGSALFDFRNEALDSNNWFANAQGAGQTPSRLYDFEGTLGGPIRRNRTFFFASYEGMRITQPLVWQQPTPTLDARAAAPTWVQPLLNLFPVPNGADLGNGLATWTSAISRPARLDVGAARLDQAITSRLTAFARYSEAPSSTEFGSSPVNFLDLRSKSLTLGVNYRPGGNWIVDLRVNGSTAKSFSTWQAPPPGTLPACYAGSVVATLAAGSPCDSLVRLSIIGVGQVAFGSEGWRSQSQAQASATAQWNFRSHSVSFGADYQHLEPIRHDFSDNLNIIASGLDTLSQDGNLWKATTPQQLTFAILQEVSAFAEDTWRMTPWLTANYGARWEISPGPVPGTPTNFLISGALTSAQQPLWSTNANFAPRGGLALRLNQSGKTVFRIGGGIYYDSSLSLATDLINGGPLNVSEYRSVNFIFTNRLDYGFLANLRLPLVTQWNATLEQALSDHDLLSVSYVGSTGHDLIRREIGGAGSNSTFWLALATNDGWSDYRALNVQYRRRLSHGLQGVASYAWSHSIDNSSTDAGLYWAGAGVTPASDVGSSDFDVRQTFTAGMSWDLPAAKKIWGGWSLDGMFRARSGFPINVLDAEQYTGVSLENAFRPDLVPGQPVWTADSSAPGGRALNPAAFSVVAGPGQGNLGRNALTGFGMSQLDLSLRREFFKGEHRALELRVEGFNVLNHANFADPVRFLSSPLFGQSSSMLNLMLGTGSPGSGLAPIFQAGGPRSLQVSLRFRF